MSDLRDATVRWLSAVLDSADTDVIGVSNWWPRATSALEAAATSPTYGEAVATACRKLQVDVLTPKSAAALADLEVEIGGVIDEWAEIVHAELPYLVAVTRLQRVARREKKPATTTQEAMPF